MEILVFKFQRPISNNKEIKIFARPWYFFLLEISLINMEILNFLFDGLIYNN